MYNKLMALKKVCVVGGGLGGMSCALDLASKGYSVTLLEKGRVLGGKASNVNVGDFSFDPGPSILILKTIYEKQFKDAGFILDDYITFTELDPIFRIHTYEKYYDFPAGLEKNLQFIRQSFPEDYNAYKKIMESCESAYKAPLETVFKHDIKSVLSMANKNFLRASSLVGPYDSIVERVFKNPILKAFFYDFPGYGGKKFTQPSPEAFMIPYIMVKYGVFYPKGGVSKIIEAYEAVLKLLGVEIRTGTELLAIEKEGKKIKKVVTNKGDFYADYFVSNIDYATLQTKYLKHINNSPSKNLIKTPSHSYFSLQIGVSEKPKILLHHNLLLNTEYREQYSQVHLKRQIPKNPTVYINAPEDRQNLFFVVSSPAIENGIDWKNFETKMKPYVFDLIKQYDIKINPDSIKAIRKQTPLYFDNEHNNYLGGLFGATDDKILFNLFNPITVDKRIKNLYYAGATVQPGAGLPMAALSGRFAAKNILSSN